MAKKKVQIQVEIMEGGELLRNDFGFRREEAMVAGEVWRGRVGIGEWKTGAS